MATYTLDELRGGPIYGNSYLQPAVSNLKTKLVLALECEGADATAYTTAVAPFGANDIASTMTGVVTLVDTWALTTSRVPTRGTSSLAVPGTGTTAYLRNAGTSCSLKSGAMAAWVYVDALPGASMDFMYLSSSSGRPTYTGSTYVWSMNIEPSGAIKWQRHYSTLDDTRTSTATIAAGGWHYISVAWFAGAVWVGVDGVVEQFAIPDVSITWSTTVTLWGTLKGGAEFAGLYVDDPIIARMVIPALCANYTPPTLGLTSLVPMTSAGFLNGFSDLVYDSSNGRDAYTQLDVKSYYKSYTALSLDTPGVSAARAYLMGVSTTNGVIDVGTGGGGPTRPSTGFLYPRGQG